MRKLDGVFEAMKKMKCLDWKVLELFQVFSFQQIHEIKINLNFKLF